MHPMTLFFHWCRDKRIAVALARDHLGARELTDWYPEWLYEVMETDEVRNTPYREAIAETVRGQIVLELGTGRKAFWALACARAGASRVYEIEANEEAFRASQAAVRSQEIDNVHLIHGFSDKVDLPEKCDVLIHDLIGDVASSEGAAAFVDDARRRFLKPDAVHIPQRCTTWFVLAEDPKLNLFERALSFGLRDFEPYEGLRFARFFEFPDAAALTQPAIFEDLVLSEPLDLLTSRRVAVRIERAGVLRGVHLFIRLHFGADRVVDTRSGQTSWATPFIRFDVPTKVWTGEDFEVSIETDLCGNPSYRLSVSRIDSNGAGEEIGHYAWTGD